MDSYISHQKYKQQQKINKFDFIEIKNFYTPKDII